MVFLNLQETEKYEPMRTLVDVLLELGGDLSSVDAFGYDFVAIAGRVATLKQALTSQPYHAGASHQNPTMWLKLWETCSVKQGA